MDPSIYPQSSLDPIPGNGSLGTTVTEPGQFSRALLSTSVVSSWPSSLR